MNDSDPGSEPIHGSDAAAPDTAEASTGERETLRAERDGYKSAYEQLLAEVGPLRSERDGYKGSYDAGNRS
ncbi:hypothetical protein VQ042_25675 [Aurantimonas sp. A2-1-M11]|uniref:hypothetical protein n=1 Tax=Aurantimonas sp. A2-1-M11 TaxID=3113712 RepID=UPI002F92B654